MFKKLLLITALVISGIITVNAQCTPDIMCTSLVCPDTVTNLQPHAQAAILYNTSMTVNVPSDTTIPPYPTPIPVDYIKYDSIHGLPLNLTATPSSPQWIGGTQGCLLISGTTNNSQAGTHKLTIYTTASAMSGAFSLPLVLSGYKIIVDSTTGISTLNLNKFNLGQNNPNPFNSNTTIEFSSSNADVYNFTVTNIIGEVVYTQTLTAVPGANKIEFSAANLPSGIYMYKLGNKSEVYTRRMIISGK